MVTPPDAKVTIKNGDKEVEFKDGQTVEKFSFGTKLDWKVEKVGSEAKEGSHVIWDEDVQKKENKVEVTLEAKTKVSIESV